MKISRFFFTKHYASTVDRQFCHSSRRIDCQFGECCLKLFANCVVIEKNTCVFAAPGRRHIRRDTVVPHARAPGFCDRVPVIRLPKPARKMAFPRYAIVVHFIGFFVQYPIMLQKMKDFERKLPSRRRHLSLARAHIVRHKSGISLSSRV